jgi:hypothetical protein
MLCDKLLKIFLIGIITVGTVWQVVGTLIADLLEVTIIIICCATCDAVSI